MNELAEEMQAAIDGLKLLDAEKGAAEAADTAASDLRVMFAGILLLSVAGAAIVRKRAYAGINGHKKGSW